MAEQIVKLRTVRSSQLAGALVWLGFEYTKTPEGTYIFERDQYFDLAWTRLHEDRDLVRRHRASKWEVKNG